METPNAQLPGDPSLPSSAKELKRIIHADAGQSKYPVEDFFRLPERSRFQLSPDGNHFSYLGPFKRRLNLFVQKADGKRPKRLTSVTERDLAWYFWKNNRRLVFAKDEAGDENFHLYAVDIDGKNLQELTPFKGVRIDLIDDLEDHEDEIIISMNKNNPQLFEPFRLNIQTGELRQLAENLNPEEPIDSWSTDHEGRLRLASKVVGGTNNTLMYRASEDLPFQDVLTTDFREGVTPLIFDFEDEHLLYVSSNIGRDKSEIVKLDLRTGKEVGQPIFSHPEVDVSSLGFSKKRKVPTAISYLTDKRHIHFLDEITRQIYCRLEGELSGYEIVITAHNRAEDKFMVRTYSDRSLGAYYLFDFQKDEITKIAEVSPWLDEH
ncbi:MAG: S9 family peptidase, partial [Bacteroidota bacterium]